MPQAGWPFQVQSCTKPCSCDRHHVTVWELEGCLRHISMVHGCSWMQVDRSHGGTDGEGWSYPVRKGAEGPQQGPEELRRRAEDRRRAVMLRRRVWARNRIRKLQTNATRGFHLSIWQCPTQRSSPLLSMSMAPSAGQHWTSVCTNERQCFECR